MGGGASSKPGGKQTPSLVSAFESFYAEVTVNTSCVIIKAKQHLAKIELVKYKNTFDKDLTQLEQLGESVPVLVDRLRTDVYRGDTVNIELAQGMSDVLAFAGIYNGFEMHVMLFAGNAPPERVVIGSQDQDHKQFNIRHDTPRQVALMNKAMIPEKIPTLLEKMKQMQKVELEPEPCTEEQTIPELRRRRNSFSGTPSVATPLDRHRPSSAAAGPTSSAWLSTPALPHRGAACAMPNRSPQSSPPISVDGDSATSVDEQSLRSGGSGKSQKGVARLRKMTAPTEPPQTKPKGKDIEWGPTACIVAKGSPRSLDAGRRLRSSSSCGAARPRRNSWSGVTSSTTQLPPTCKHGSAQ